jgi:ppGpp synthetase/RelA/SpoT-type nucleotidyltranferase
MTDGVLSAGEATQVDELVGHYVASIGIYRNLVEAFRATIIENAELRKLYHSARWRVKEPDHLRHKLAEKLLKSKTAEQAFTITKANLFERINDLAGARLLHLHSTEFPAINEKLLALLEENVYSIIEGPVARVWDNEYKQYYESIAVGTIDNPRMYTSVHYIVQPSAKTKRTMEIQVRTLAEELWGEVDHSINYPVQSPKRACREQIKVLARLTSSCSRLVDSIFLSHGDSE